MCSLIADASVRSSSHSGRCSLSRSRFLRRSHSRLSWKSRWSFALMNFEDAFGVVDALHVPRPIQDLRDVDELDRQAQPLGAPLLMHEAGHVAGDDVLRAGLLVVGHLVVAHLRRHRFLEHRERAAESAALVGTLRRHEPDALHPGQQVERLREERLVDLGHLGGSAAPATTRSRCAARPRAGTPPTGTRGPRARRARTPPARRSAAGP